MDAKMTIVLMYKDNTELALSVMLPAQAADMIQIKGLAGTRIYLDAHVSNIHVPLRKPTFEDLKINQKAG